MFKAVYEEGDELKLYTYKNILKGNESDIDLGNHSITRFKFIQDLRQLKLINIQDKPIKQSYLDYIEFLLTNMYELNQNEYKSIFGKGSCPIQCRTLTNEQNVNKFIGYLKINLENYLTNVELISNDQLEVCHKFVDINKNLTKEVEPTPMWDSWLSRFEEIDRTLFMAFTFSIFKADSRVKAMLYILDREGSTGKSLISRVFDRYIGKENSNAVISFNPKDNGRFSNVGLDKALIILISENTELNLLENPTIKKILGNDRMTIEGKGTNQYDTYVKGKIMVFSNERLYSNNKSSNNDRLLEIEIVKEQDISHPKVSSFFKKDKKDKNKVQFLENVNSEMVEDAFIEELDSFLIKCKEHYGHYISGDLLISPKERDIRKTGIDLFIDTYFDIEGKDFYSINDIKKLTYKDGISLNTFDACVEHFREELDKDLSIPQIKKLKSTTRYGDAGSKFKKSGERMRFKGVKLKNKFKMEADTLVELINEGEYNKEKNNKDTYGIE
jgi:hypothetical protein